MDPSSDAIVQLWYVAYRKMHFLWILLLFRTVFRCLSFVHDRADVVHSYPTCSAFPTIHTLYTIHVISHNNIYLFNFLFTSNGNSDGIIIRPTLVTLYFIIIYLLLMFLWTFQSRLERTKQTETNTTIYEYAVLRLI